MEPSRTRTPAHSRNDFHSSVFDKPRKNESVMDRQKKMPEHNNSMAKLYAKGLLAADIRLFTTMALCVLIPCVLYLYLAYKLSRYNLVSRWMSGWKSSSSFKVNGTFPATYYANSAQLGKHFCKGTAESIQCYEVFRDLNFSATFIIFFVSFMHVFFMFMTTRDIYRRYNVLKVRLERYAS